MTHDPPCSGYLQHLYVHVCVTRALSSDHVLCLIYFQLLQLGSAYSPHPTLFVLVFKKKTIATKETTYACIYVCVCDCILNHA